MRVSGEQGAGVAVDRSSLEVDGLEGLERVLAPSVNAVVARRALAPDLPAALAAALGEPGDHVALIGPKGEGLKRLVAWLAPGPTRQALERDARLLATRFARLTAASELKATLCVIDDGACRKFHADRVGLRLLCTYVGPGTEWLEEGEFDRSLLLGLPCRSPGDLERFNAEVSRHGAATRRARAGDVVVLKGTAWPGNEARGVIHRSPPASPSAPRLLLKLDLLHGVVRALPA